MIIFLSQKIVCLNHITDHSAENIVFTGDFECFYSKYCLIRTNCLAYL